MVNTHAMHREEKPSSAKVVGLSKTFSVHRVGVDPLTRSFK
jgi:hypothetical protein